MRWSKRIIGPAVSGGFFGLPTAAHAAADGSLHLIVKQHDGSLRELWWTDTTSGAGDLTGHGVPPAIPDVVFGSGLGGVASYVTPADGRQHVVYVAKDRQLWSYPGSAMSPRRAATCSRRPWPRTLIRF